MRVQVISVCGLYARKNTVLCIILIIYDDGMSACRDLEAEGVKRKGRSRKSWGECVRNDLTGLEEGLGT